MAANDDGSTDGPQPGSDDLVEYVPIPEDVVGMDAFDAAEQDILDMLNRKVAGGESIERIMDFVYEASRGVWPCDRIGLAFVDDDGQRITSRWVRAEYEPVIMDVGFTEDLNGSTLQPLIQGKLLRVINDLEEYFRRNPGSRSTRVLMREGVMASMTCPLVVDGRCVGMIFRSSRKKNVYGPREVWMHLAVSERIAQAVDKAWRIRQLEQANAAYMEMLGFVAHELKSPVASMVLDASTLLEGYLGELDDTQKDRLRRMTSKGEYLLGLVRDYMDLARVETGDLSATMKPDVDITELIRQAIDIVEPQAVERRMRIETEFPDDPAARKLECDPDLLKIVAVNLIGNAVKYGFEEGLVLVQVSTDGARMKVSVRNDGPGFSQAARRSLFKKFSRLKDPELMKRKGTGVGLYTVWRIVNLHKGRVDAESEQGSWARFSFEIPVSHSV
ncbi:MAG TPA: GAF domain-containing sensor histidine kinase [Myxococcota bacterium]|nr:GAF domain-containing sensor histidine kinase [Myxococcota bacterium]HNZ03702.1 GAF domain-containing sensor histidine kinase [Myxococcota bacterium]HOD07873.1 GAF domain-containing sensor histidine kinase [Myxococcota bacterium]HPB51756.1 GAF domain-containing sensor histidine kinase [Myxococcota bacterium]HQP96002.1 GAF domain-containing sensor histidine kinase [Myxococcota bacterium]